MSNLAIIIAMAYPSIGFLAGLFILMVLEPEEFKSTWRHHRGVAAGALVLWIVFWTLGWPFMIVKFWK